MIDLQVTAWLDTPVIGTLSPLDAPLSYAAYQRAVRDGKPLPPMTDEYVTDFPLPLSRWEREGVWGWCTSDAIVSIHDFSTSWRYAVSQLPVKWQGSLKLRIIIVGWGR